MSWHKDAPGRQPEGTSETAAGAAISDIKIPQPSSFQKPTDPGAHGLAINISALPTSELREMVQLLTSYAPVMGFHGRRRRAIAMRELVRRMAVRS